MPPTSAAEQGQRSRAALIAKYRTMTAANLIKPPPTRSQRFAARQRGETVPTNFQTFAKIPYWAIDPQTDTARLGWAAGLLFHQPQLRRELDGAKLRALAEACGEALLDAVTDADVPALASQNELLPDTADIHQQGCELVAIAQREEASSEQIALCDQAHRLCLAAMP